MSKKEKIILGVSLFVLTLTITLIILASPVVPLKCALCKDTVQKMCLAEYLTGPWREIPVLHPDCHNHISKHLAPNCDMTVGEWLEKRGWEPRPPETTGMSYQELLDFLNKD